MSRPAVFLDRDGTLTVERERFVTRPAQLRLQRGAARAVAALNRRGFLVILLTNQSAIARGLVDRAGLAAIHATLEARLARHGAHLDDVFVCPHHPMAKLRRYRRHCRCRKPKPGLLERALAKHDVDLTRSFLVGDDLRDLALCVERPLRPVLVRTGKGQGVEVQARETHGARLHVGNDLAAAVKWILAQDARGMAPGSVRLSPRARPRRAVRRSSASGGGRGR